MDVRCNIHICTKVAAFLSASFVRLGGAHSTHSTSSSNDSGSNINSEGMVSRSIGGGDASTDRSGISQQQREQKQGSKEAWDKEMEDKAEGWETQWDEERQRFYYYRAETGEASYTAPFKISVSPEFCCGMSHTEPNITPEI